MSIQVGDLVEITGCKYPENRHFIGTQGIVLGFVSNNVVPFEPIAHVSQQTQLTNIGIRKGFGLEHLRKINPGNEACDESFEDVINNCNGVLV